MVWRSGWFHSGTFAHLQQEVERLPADILYLLPFFKPGFFDLHTGADVRKGSLGSVYAVADFFQVDPALVTPPGEVDLQVLTGSLQSRVFRLVYMKHPIFLLLHQGPGDTFCKRMEGIK